MQSVTCIPLTGSWRIIVGVDTHRYSHVAVALDQVGVWIGERAILVDRAGDELLEGWARELGETISFGIGGTGSCGAGLAWFLRRRGYRVVEVNCPDRQVRHRQGKNGPVDAEAAVRVVLAGTVSAVPKSADGTVEMIRQVKIVKDSAVAARSQAMTTLKSVVVTAPARLRGQMNVLSDARLIQECRQLSYDSMTGPGDATCYTLRALAQRYHELDGEVRLRERVLQTLTGRAASELTSRFGIGPGSAAELLVLVGDNPGRIRSEGALAKLAGACPIPASSGKTTRHRLNRGGHRQANAALHRIIVSRMRFHQPTMDYVARRTAEGKTKREIRRCLKRLLVREIYQILVVPHKTQERQLAA